MTDAHSQCSSGPPTRRSSLNLQDLDTSLLQNPPRFPGSEASTACSTPGEGIGDQWANIPRGTSSGSGSDFTRDSSRCSSPIAGSSDSVSAIDFADRHPSNWTSSMDAGFSDLAKAFGDDGPPGSTALSDLQELYKNGMRKHPLVPGLIHDPIIHPDFFSEKLMPPTERIYADNVTADQYLAGLSHTSSEAGQETIDSLRNSLQTHRSQLKESYRDTELKRTSREGPSELTANTAGPIFTRLCRGYNSSVCDTASEIPESLIRSLSAPIISSSRSFQDYKQREEADRQNLFRKRGTVISQSIPEEAEDFMTEQKETLDRLRPRLEAVLNKDTGSTGSQPSSYAQSLRGTLNKSSTGQNKFLMQARRELWLKKLDSARPRARTALKPNWSP